MNNLSATDIDWQSFAGCRLDPVIQQFITPMEIFDLSYKDSKLLKMQLCKVNQVLERHEALMEISEG